MRNSFIGHWISYRQIARLFTFAAISAAGLGLDVTVFALLVRLGCRAGYANLVSASLAVTLVYFSSTKQVFKYAGRFLLPLFLAYLAYQVLAITAASWAVDILVTFGISPILAKGTILPITFSCNYLFLDFLTRTRG
jgi:GtrA-like protein